MNCANESSNAGCNVMKQSMVNGFIPVNSSRPIPLPTSCDGEFQKNCKLKNDQSSNFFSLEHSWSVFREESMRFLTIYIFKSYKKLLTQEFVNIDFKVSTLHPSVQQQLGIWNSCGFFAPMCEELKLTVAAIFKAVSL